MLLKTDEFPFHATFKISTENVIKSLRICCVTQNKSELVQSLTPLSFTFKVAPLAQTPSSPDSHDRHLRREMFSKGIKVTVTELI